jgi:FAD/FMN-containing dehydrogenase
MLSEERSLAEKLRQAAHGLVVVDEKSLRMFSTDRSIYEIQPQIAILPDDADDVQRIVEFARKEGLPITPRGGGSGTGGGALGQGLVLALPRSEYWENISDFSEAGGSAQVTASAGVFHNDLQIYLKSLGYFLPADVTSAAISRIGGNIATKASGPHALRYGSIDRFLESVEFVTSRGEFIDTADETTIPERFKNRLADLGQRLRADEAARGFLESRKDLKTASGYNLRAFLQSQSPGRLIAQLMAGSVGTLGLITRATLSAETYVPEQAVILLSFDDLAETGRAVMHLRELDVAAIELVSRETLRIIRERSAVPAQLAMDAHLLFVELTGPDRQDSVNRVITLLEREDFRMSASPVVVTRSDELEKLWNARKSILRMIEHPKPGFRALAVVNDVGVPPARLAEFISGVEQIFAVHGVMACIYGHAGNGNLHLRPLFDMSLPDLAGRVQRLADDIYGAVIRHGGTVTAEHGMGRLRAPWLRQEWGEALYRYMRELKELFDPEGILNPGVMFSEGPITEHMRPDLLKP